MNQIHSLISEEQHHAVILGNPNSLQLVFFFFFFFLKDPREKSMNSTVLILFKVSSIC